MSIILDSFIKSLEIVLASNVTANQLPVTVTYTNNNLSNTLSYTTNNTSIVTIAAQPYAGTQNTISNICVENKDTNACQVIIRINDSVNIYEQANYILNVGDKLYYENGRGWYCVDLFGNFKELSNTSSSIITDSMTYIQLSGTDTYTGNILGLVSYAQILNLQLGFIIPNANLTTTPTVNLNGFGTINFSKFGRSAMEAGDFKANQMILAAYDGTYMQVQSVTDKIVNA